MIISEEVWTLDRLKAALADRIGAALPDTLVGITRSEGEHHWFKMPDGAPIGNVGSLRTRKTLNCPSNHSNLFNDSLQQTTNGGNSSLMQTQRTATMEGRTLDTVSPMEGAPLPRGFMSFDDVQDRLVEAMLTCWRYPDRERGWQTLRCAWPEISRDVWAGDYDARGGDGTSGDVTLRPAA